MEVLHVKIESARDAKLIKSLLKKFDGVSVKSQSDPMIGEKLTKPGSPVSWDEFNRQLEVAEQQLKNGEGISIVEAKHKMLQWRKERKRSSK